jgi:hypothetical protein
LIVLAAPEAARQEFTQAWTAGLSAGIGWPSAADLGWIAKNAPWYLWPLWPLAGWTLYSWRHTLRHPHVLLPATMAAGGCAALLTAEPPTDSALLALVPPMVMLAAFGAPTLRRNGDKLIDWLAIALFSLFALAAWLYYLAWITGQPPRMAYSVQRLVPGLGPQVHPVTVAFAAAATLAWFMLVWWRIRLRPAMLWRGAVLAASGLTMLWVLLVTLFLPAVDFNRSYAPLAAEVGQAARKHSTADDCVEAYRLLGAHRALFAFHGGLKFERPASNAQCTLLLHRDSRRSQLDDEPPPVTNWQLVWQGLWPARPDETWRLYRRIP